MGQLFFWAPISLMGDVQKKKIHNTIKKIKIKVNFIQNFHLFTIALKIYYYNYILVAFNI